MSIQVEKNYPSERSEVVVKQSFYDDSSAMLGLPHNYRGYASSDMAQCSPDERERKRLEDEERRAQKRIADKAQYLEETGAGEQAARLIEYYRLQGMRPSDATEMGIERFLSLAAGVYGRMWRYVDAGLELETAILKAEMELTEEADIEAQAIAEAECRDERPDDAESLSVRALEELMDMHRKTKGGGSKSKSRKTITKPDAPAVEQRLRRQMAA